MKSVFGKVCTAFTLLLLFAGSAAACSTDTVVSPKDSVIQLSEYRLLQSETPYFLESVEATSTTDTTSNTSHPDCCEKICKCKAVSCHALFATVSSSLTFNAQVFKELSVFIEHGVAERFVAPLFRPPIAPLHS
ncbi:hypothetical protein [Salinimonas lutimaris]|mgnify:CR=1 FL=1|uniref:hypothetical protein n=1 Tax=Salinimonas lutimaris TaxID=914153 RepID=UPI0010BF8BC8|nr:hypothetical protein [Salinimonas lutimaris]